MKHPLLLSSLLVSVLTLAGCSGTLLESKKVDYRSAGKLPTLEIPPDLTTPNRDERYAIPESSKDSATFSAYSGEHSGQVRTTVAQEVLPQTDKVRMERAGTQRWLVVNVSPEQLWPMVKTFWQTTGFTLDMELPAVGIMETEWNENRAKLPQDFIRSAVGKTLDFMYSTSERDKFRTRLEKGSAPGTTEIYISHRGMYEVYTNEGRSETRWQPRPADPELEAEMLQRLMVRLGVDGERAKTLASSEQTVEERAKLGRAGDGSDQLIVQESFDRTWRRVGLALDRMGYTVEDRNRAQGIYFVRYVDPQADFGKKKEDKGFLTRLAFWRSDKSTPQQTAQNQSRIQVKGEGTSSTVQVMTHEGRIDKSDAARKMLGLLLEQIK